MSLFDQVKEPLVKYTPRYYQQAAIDAGVSFFRSDAPGHGLMVEPTGSGKSLVIAGIVDGMDEECVVFQPSQEILMQNWGKLRDYGYYAAIFSASLNRKQTSRITLATIGSAINRLKDFERYRYIIIDECHGVNASTDANNGKKSMYLRYIEHMQKVNSAKVIGLTATPYRLHTNRYDGANNKFLTRTQDKVFTHVLHYTQIQELYREGYLAKLIYYPVPGFTRKGIKLNSKGTDFNDKDLAQRFKEIGFDNILLRTMLKLVPIRRSILVFTKFVWEAQSLANRLNSESPGMAAVVSDETPPVLRKRLVEQFKSGQLQVMVNVGVFTTGFDHPPLDAVVLARPTMSLSLYYQMVGRGMRPDPSKTHCKVVDLCENLALFGKVEDLELKAEGKNGDLWYFSGTDGRRLTNIPFGER